MKLGLVAYLVPFLFVYAPELLIQPKHDVVLSVSVMTITTALIGCYLLALTVEGYLFDKLSRGKRIFVGIMAACLFLPISVWQFSWVINIIAIVISAIFILHGRRASKKTG